MDEAVCAVWILDEVLGVAAGIPSPMLREEYAVCMISPPGASSPHVIGPKALRKLSASYGVADVFDEPTHGTKCGIDGAKLEGVVGLDLSSHRELHESAPMDSPTGTPSGRPDCHRRLILSEWRIRLSGGISRNAPNSRRSTICSKRRFPSSPNATK